ncbi:ankyrin repeat protein, partial [Dactylonectria macrodidyma]
MHILSPFYTIYTTARNTPIHMAASRGLADVVDELLLSGYSVDDKGPDDDSPTSLEFAIFGRDLKTVELLVEKGASLTFAHSFTAVHCAAAAGSLDLVAKFLRKGVDINGQDDRGNTPLYYALS